jgi:hypothetical protein
MKIKTKKTRNPKPPIQGALLMELMTNKYDEHEKASEELNKVSRLFDKNGRKLILSKTGDDIYYLTQHLREARKILEKFNG